VPTPVRGIAQAPAGASRRILSEGRATVVTMDEVLMLRGVHGFCPDCGDRRVLLPADDDGFCYCCTDCDAAVVLLELCEEPTEVRRAG
jgi:hypothetical protein